MNFIKVIFRSFVDFFRDNGMVHAASISYYSVMAIIPFCLLLVAIFGHFLGQDEELLLFFTEKLEGFFPEITYEIIEEVQKIIAYKGIGRYTLIFYLLLSYQLFSALEAAMNVIFKTEGKRPFVVSLLLSLFIITTISIFIVISFGATSAISVLAAFKEYFPVLKIGKLIGFFIGYVIPFILLLLTTTVLYAFLPKGKVKFYSVIRGALFASIFFEIAKHLFTIYVVEVAKLGTIYGPLSAFVLFLLWVFYSSCIFLIGAEITHNVETSRSG